MRPKKPEQEKKIHKFNLYFNPKEYEYLEKKAKEMYIKPSELLQMNIKKAFNTFEFFKNDPDNPFKY